MKNFLISGSESSMDIVHIPGNESVYNVSELDGALIYTSKDGSRQYTMSTSIETLRFNRVNADGNLKFTWEDKIRPFTPRKSCKHILNDNLSVGSGIYTIKPNNTAFEVYCDMETDGGGWTVTWRSQGALSVLQYDELTEAIWVENETEFLWHTIKDGNDLAIIKTKFNNSYNDWKIGQDGGNGGIAGTAYTPPLNATWYINIPSIGVDYNYNKTGIVRAIPFRRTAPEKYNNTSYGLHYKRSNSGEHYPWFDATGNMTNEGYLCNDANVCGYTYGTISGATHILAVR